MVVFLRKTLEEQKQTELNQCTVSCFHHCNLGILVIIFIQIL